MMLGCLNELSSECWKVKGLFSLLVSNGSSISGIILADFLIPKNFLLSLSSVSIWLVLVKSGYSMTLLEKLEKRYLETLLAPMMLLSKMGVKA